MKNIITTLTTGTMSGSVFYGNAAVSLHDKVQKFIVCNHLVAGRTMTFRSITKVKAGWNTIADFTCTPEQLWYHINKTTQCVQVQVNGGHWHNVYITKGGLWQMVDVLLLDTCTVSDIHRCAPKMYCHNTFVRTNAKTHACLAFVVNENKSKAA